MTRRSLHSGKHFFASAGDLAHVVLPQPVRPPDEEVEVELPQPVESPNVALPQPVPPPDELRPVVTIYVRKGDHAKERTISINPVPDCVDSMMLLDAGFALDGNSATVSVQPGTYVDATALSEGRIDIDRHTSDDPTRDSTLTQAVNAVERALVYWLRELGCEVKFG